MNNKYLISVLFVDREVVVYAKNQREALAKAKKKARAFKIHPRVESADLIYCFDDEEGDSYSHLH